MSTVVTAQTSSTVQKMSLACYRFVVLVLTTAAILVARSVAEADDDDTHYLSHGPIRSDKYYWVPSDNPDADYNSKSQDQAIQHLEECRAEQDEEIGDRLVPLATAEEVVRVCMLEHGWTRRWTESFVIY